MKLGDTQAKRLGKGIRKARMAMGLSRGQFASRANIAEAYLASIEEGLELDIRRELLERLAVCLRPWLFAARAVGLSTEQVCREFTDDQLLTLFTIGQEEVRITPTLPLPYETLTDSHEPGTGANQQTLGAPKRFYWPSYLDSTLEICTKCSTPYFGGARCLNCGAHQGGHGPDD